MHEHTYNILFNHTIIRYSVYIYIILITRLDKTRVLASTKILANIHIRQYYIYVYSY